MVRPRVRIRFSKQAAIRLIGHRDLMRGLERLFRRAGLALAMSQGFHPKPLMTFPLALAVGIEGWDEVMELELTESPSPDELLARRLGQQATPGLRFLSAEILPPGTRKARIRSATYQIAVPAPRREGLDESIGRLMAASTWPMCRPHRSTPIDLRASLLALAIEEGVLTMRLRTEAGSSAGPRDVLTVLGLENLEHEGVCLQRTAVEIDA